MKTIYLGDTAGKMINSREKLREKSSRAKSVFLHQSRMGLGVCRVLFPGPGGSKASIYYDIIQFKYVQKSDAAGVEPDEEFRLKSSHNGNS